jgi:hypothetical protein
MPNCTPLLRRTLRLSMAAALCALLTGCQGIQMGTAQLRVIDASADAGALDTYGNSQGLAYSLGYGSLTSYMPTTPGQQLLTAARSSTSQTLVETSAHLLAAHQYTEIVSGSVATMQQTVLQDQTWPAPAGQIELRFFHAAIHAGAVDVYLVARNGRLAATAPIATNLSFRASTGYLVVPAGTYAIDVVPAGTVPTNTTITQLSGPQVAYDAGAVRTVVLIDAPAVTPTPAASPTAVEKPGSLADANVVHSVGIIVANDADAS